MKIAFIVNNYPPRTGGVEFHVQALAQEMLRREHEPIIVTLGQRASDEMRSGIRVITLSEHLRVADILGFPNLGTRARLTRLIRNLGIEAVSVHTRFFPMTYLGYSAGRKANVPVVLTEHGSGHVASESLVIRLASRFVDYTLGRAVMRGADRVLGVSEDVCDFVERLAGVKSDVFYNAIHLDDTETHSPAQSMSGTVAKLLRLTFVGRLVSGKGWQAFLEVVSLLRDEGYALAAEVFGDGPDRAALEAAIISRDLADLVVVHGRVSQEVLRRGLADVILVNPTILSEGFQTTLLEAIAEGGRVVTYPVPGAARLRDDGAPVVITEEKNPRSLFDAIIECSERSPALASRAMLNSWSWEHRAEQFEHVLTEVHRASQTRLD